MDSFDVVSTVRRFSRFYTRRFGMLEPGLLHSPFPLIEARVLYELGRGGGRPATELAAVLSVDPGYLSRILSSLEDRELVQRASDPDDGRVRLASLTTEGREAFDALDRASADQVGEMLGPLSTVERIRLVDSLDAAEALLGDTRPEPVPYVLRPPRPGDLGWMVQSQSAFYCLTYGWDHQFEALAAEVVAEFLRTFEPTRERCWIAEREGVKVGSVFVRARSEEEAQLRMLYVDPSARGLGIGRRLVEECTRFARETGYRRIMLWTNEGLDSARRIYESEGYVLGREEPHEDFGTPLVGQYWEMEL